MDETDQSPAAAEEEKRPFQFGLSTLFIVMTLWAVFCTIAATFGLKEAVIVAEVAAWIAAVIYSSYYRLQFGWVGAVVVVCLMGVSGVLPYLLMMPSQAPQRARTRCISNLKQIGLALLQYEASHGCFPPAYVADESGKPMHSWRVLILPYLEEKGLYDRYDFDEPWNGPNNSKLHDTVMDIFRCPSEKLDAKKTDTSYVVVVGPGTMFPGKESLSRSDISDSATCTLMVVEMANSGIHWMEPRDPQITKMAPTINPPAGQGISSEHPGLANVAFGDGSVRALGTKQLTPKQLQALLSRDGGEEVDVDEW